MASMTSPAAASRASVHHAAARIAPRRAVAPLVAARGTPVRCYGSMRVNAAADFGDKPLKDICKAEIPAFIPRTIFMNEMYRWAALDLVEHKGPEFGLPVKVDTLSSSGANDGFCIDIFNPSGEHYVAQLVVKMDDEPVTYYEKIERGEGEELLKKSGAVEVVGRYMEIKKVGMEMVDPEYTSSVKGLLAETVSAVDKFYTFGSPFNEE
mmetsp:Transcript_50635/g.162058  ORF Transcript_50635/g.162058 Transcript_50635/m.162058 type:complete len:209 (+) Transcript_50635:48-674(+)